MSVIRETVDRILGPGYGCADSSCVFGRKPGMSTNGGCRCFKGSERENARAGSHMVMVARALAQEVEQLRPLRQETVDLIAALAPHTCSGGGDCGCEGSNPACAAIGRAEDVLASLQDGTPTEAPTSTPRDDLMAGRWTWIGDLLVGRDPERSDRFLAISQAADYDAKIKVHGRKLSEVVDEILERFNGKEVVRP